MVHYNAKYGNFTAAVPHEDGLAVLGIFIQVRDKKEIRKYEVTYFKILNNKCAIHLVRGKRQYSFPSS